MPMILMGDEIRRSQLGNNNAYCQDNEISWFDWTLAEPHADVLRFVRLLIERRLLRDTRPELDVGEGVMTAEQFAVALPELIEWKDFR